MGRDCETLSIETIFARVRKEKGGRETKINANDG